MVQKRKLNLVNHTVYDWIKTYQNNNEVTTWHFPEIIPAKSSVEVVVEWGEENDKQDGEGGKINYVLFGSLDRSFQIQTSPKNGCELEIHFLNIMTPEYPIGSTLNIGLKRKGKASFVLAGTADEFEIPKA